MLPKLHPGNLRVQTGAGFEPGFARSAWRVRPLDGRFRRRTFRNLKVKREGIAGAGQRDTRQIEKADSDESPA